MRDTSTRCLDALLASCSDDNAAVRDQVVKTLTLLATRDLIGVVRRCEQWLSTRKHSTTPHTHRMVILSAIISILADQRSDADFISQIPNDLRDALIQCALSEMTAVSELNSDWTKRGMSLFIDLGRLYPKQAADTLIGTLQSNQLPHLHILLSMSTLADEVPFRMIPFIKEGMARLLPILSLAKQDNYRMAFALVLGSFGDAALEVCAANALRAAAAAAHQEEAQEPLTPRSLDASSAKTEDYHESMYSAIQFLIGDWSRSSEARVRTAVVFALGALFALCSDSSRTSLLGKVLPLVIAGVKREKPKEQALVARGFAASLRFVSDEVAYALQSQLDTAILPLLIQSVALAQTDKEFHSNPEIKKTIEYLFKAAEHLAEFNMDGITTHVSRMLDARSTIKDPAQRAAGIHILKHLVSQKYLEPRLAPYKDSIIATIKLAQSDGDWRVRSAIAACVVAMGMASQIKFFEALGGSDLLTYIVKSAAIPTSENGADELRDTSRNTLALFCTTQGKLDRSMWPFLMEHLGQLHASPSLLNAFPTVCRSLVQLGANVSQTDFFYVDFTVSVNVPKPHVLAAVFLVQALQRGHYSPTELHAVLEAMSTIAPLLDDPFAQQNVEEVVTPVANTWLGMIPDLQKALLIPSALVNENGAPIDEEDQWEEAVSKLINKTMTCKQSEQWVEDVTASCLSLLQAFQTFDVKMLRGALLLIGIGLGRCGKRDFVQQAVNTIIDIANHDNYRHRIGLAKALGYVAALHPDLVMDRLSALSKGPEKKGFFASKDKTKKELSENSRSISAMGIGWSGRRMQPGIFMSRMDAMMLPTLTTILAECKLLDVKESVYQCASLLEAPLRKQTTVNAQFSFKSRDSFIESLLKSVPLESGPSSSGPSSPSGKGLTGDRRLFDLTMSAMRAVTNLVDAVATPVLSSSVIDKILVFVGQYVTKNWTEMHPALEDMGHKTATNLLAAVFLNQPTLDVDTLVPLSLEHTTLANDMQRERAVLLVVRLLELCADRADHMLAESLEIRSKVTVGPLIGRLVPRFMDTAPRIRQLAADGIIASFRVIAALHPAMITTHTIDADSCMDQVAALKERTLTLVKDGTAGSEKEVASIIKALCMQVVTMIPEPDVFVPLLDTLLAAGITDPQDDAASCSCVVMHGMIRGLGQHLSEPDCKRSLANLIDAIDKVKGREQSLSGILVSIRNLVKHHSLLCFHALLKYPVPHRDATVKAFQAVAGDGALAESLIAHCLDTILNSQLVEDCPDPKDSKKLIKDLAVTPLASVCALGWIAGTPKGAAVIAENYRAAVYCSILLYLTAAHEHGNLTKVAVVVDALRSAVTETSEVITNDRLERYGWAGWSEPLKFPRATMELVKYLCREELGESETVEGDRRLLLDPVYGLPLDPSEPTALAVDLGQFILPYINKPIKSHRRTAIHICGALLRHSLNEKKFLQSLATALLSRSGSDEDAVLRRETLDAFPNLCEHDYSFSQPYISPMLAALMSNFTDTVLSVSTTSMRAACEIIRRVENKDQVSPISVNIILKAKTLFESKEATQRALSYDVYDLLLELGIEGHMDEQTIEQQIYLHLLTLLVHSEEDDEKVRKSVRRALHHSAKFIIQRFSNKKRQDAVDGAAKLEELFAKNCIAIDGDSSSATGGSSSGGGGGGGALVAALRTRFNYFDDFLNEFSAIWVAYFPGRVNDLLVSAMGFFHSDRELLRGAAVDVCGFMLKHLPAEELVRANVDQLCNTLIASLNPGKEKSPRVRGKVARAIGMLGEL